jgi:hypothetical protein
MKHSGKAYCPTADIDRVYVSRKQGGRGSIKVEGTYIAEVNKLIEHAQDKEQPLKQIARTQLYNKNSTLFQEVNNLKKVLDAKQGKERS